MCLSAIYPLKELPFFMQKIMVATRLLWGTKLSPEICFENIL